jgi:hypothetical protein
MYNVTAPTAEHTYRYLEPSSVLETGSQAENGLGELGRIAEHAGAAESGRKWWYGGATAWAGFDRLGNRWALTVLPSMPDVAFAGAATVAVAARDGDMGHPEAPLELALERELPLTPPRG